jgi:hypothetical protein
MVDVVTVLAPYKTESYEKAFSPCSFVFEPHNVGGGAYRPEAISNQLLGNSLSRALDRGGREKRNKSLSFGSGAAHDALNFVDHWHG